MGCHSLTDNPLQSGKADTILILQQFAHSPDTAVPQMIDIIGIADAVLQMHIIVNGCQNIFFCDMLGHKFMDILADSFFDRVLIPRILLQNL